MVAGSQGIGGLDSNFLTLEGWEMTTKKKKKGQVHAQFIKIIENISIKLFVRSFNLLTVYKYGLVFLSIKHTVSNTKLH